MSKSSHIRTADIHLLYRLAGECRDVGDDANVWRHHFAEGLARLVGADLVFAGELVGLRAGQPADLGSIPWGLDAGFNAAGWLKALEYLSRKPDYSLALAGYAARLRVSDGIALSRTAMVPDADWYASDEYQVVYRTVGGDHSVYCFRSIPGADDQVSGVTLTRAAGRRDFGCRELAIVQEAHALVGPLVGGPLARYTEPSPSDLSPRVREVLKCLIEGDGDKQIAKRLSISPHTVNVHTKAIYLHFGVRGRAELLARWIRRGWGGRCAWADPL